MDLISLTVGLPLAPIRGLLALARLLQDEADQELYSPARVRRELEEIEAAQSSAELSDEAAEAEAEQAVDRLVRR
jgi:Gas vesicle protein G